MSPSIRDKVFLVVLQKKQAAVSSDGFKSYINAVPNAFEGNVDFGMVDKQYEANRYVGAVYTAKNWKPKKISTSLVERQNLTIRMSNRRLTRKTNGFSKKLENHIYQLAINMVYYNFVRVHATIKTTPALKAGLTDYKWALEDVVELGMWSDVAQ